MLLSVSPLNSDAILINQTFGKAISTTVGKAVATADNGDFVATWSQTDNVLDAAGNPITINRQPADPVRRLGSLFHPGGPAHHVADQHRQQQRRRSEHGRPFFAHLQHADHPGNLVFGWDRPRLRWEHCRLLSDAGAVHVVVRCQRQRQSGSGRAGHASLQRDPARSQRRRDSSLAPLLHSRAGRKRYQPRDRHGH